MLKGISRQVIVVRSPDPELFEQAIFVLRDGGREVSDEVLLKEANRLIGKRHQEDSKRKFGAYFFWAASGALTTSLLWLVALLL